MITPIDYDDLEGKQRETVLIVHFDSGVSTIVPLDGEVADMDPQVAAKKFIANPDFLQSPVLSVNNLIIYLDKVEFFEFKKV